MAAAEVLQPEQSPQDTVGRCHTAGDAPAPPHLLHPGGTHPSHQGLCVSDSPLATYPASALPSPGPSMFLRKLWSYQSLSCTKLKLEERKITKTTSPEPVLPSHHPLEIKTHCQPQQVTWASKHTKHAGAGILRGLWTTGMKALLLFWEELWKSSMLVNCSQSKEVS